MKALLVSNDPTIFERDSAARLRHRAYAAALGELHVVSRAAVGTQEEQEGTLFLYPIPHGHFVARIRMWFRVRSLVRERHIDVVSAQDPFEFGLIALLAKGEACFHVQVHTDAFSPRFTAGSLVNRIRQIIARYVLMKADHIRVVSRRIKKSIMEKVGRESNVLSIYVDVQRFKNAAVPQTLLERLTRFRKVMLVVSRLEPEKNVSLALRSFAASTPADACLVVLGEGRQKEKLRREAEKLGISERVLFEGWKDPAPYYKRADLTLVPSLYEGYGITVIESLFAGTPVLAMNVGIAEEVGAQIADTAEEFQRYLKAYIASEKYAPVVPAYGYEDFSTYVRAWVEDLTSCARGK